MRARARVWQRHRARILLRAGARFDDRASAWPHSDAWMTFLARVAAEGAHVPLYAGRATAAGNTRASCASPRTSTRTRARPGAADLRHAQVRRRARRRRSTSGVRGPSGFQIDARAGNGPAVATTGSTTAAGRPEARSPSTRPRPTHARPSGPAFKHDVRVYFYWHAVHWRHNSQKGRAEPERVGRQHHVRQPRTAEQARR